MPTNKSSESSEKNTVLSQWDSETIDAELKRILTAIAEIVSDSGVAVSTALSNAQKIIDEIPVRIGQNEEVNKERKRITQRLLGSIIGDITAERNKCSLLGDLEIKNLKVYTMEDMHTKVEEIIRDILGIDKESDLDDQESLALFHGMEDEDAVTIFLVLERAFNIKISIDSDVFRKKMGLSMSRIIQYLLNRDDVHITTDTQDK